MPVHLDHEEESDWDDDAFPDEEEEQEDFTVNCPACGADIYEDAPQCPVCGEYVTGISRNFWTGKPAWYILLGFLGIVAVIAVLLFAR